MLADGRIRFDAVGCVMVSLMFPLLKHSLKLLAPCSQKGLATVVARLVS